jgi:hypothetical protein
VSIAGVAVATLALSIHSASPAPPDTGAYCDPQKGICAVEVTKDGRPAHRQRKSHPVKGSQRGEARSTSTAPCRYVLYDPQPPKSDSIWGGNTTGAIYSYLCEEGQDFVAVVWRGAPPAGADGPAVTAAELAQQARALLKVPKPRFQRSPDQSFTDAGTPITWVNLWTWYWTTETSWRPTSKTASLGDVSATVTATPQTMTFKPGNGKPPVTCPGPGRAWTETDGNAAPSDGGCAYRYTRPSDRVTATLSIRWSVAWEGSDGTSGQLPAMTTQTSDSFAVQQIQTVNR